MTAPKYGSEQFAKFFYTSESADSRPTSWEIALHTNNPGTGDANEVSGGTYQRQSVTFETSDEGGHWDAVSDIDVTFPAAGSGQSYTVTHYSIRNAANGECLAVAQLPVPIPVVEGGIVSFPSSYIRVRGV